MTRALLLLLLWPSVAGAQLILESAAGGWTDPTSSMEFDGTNDYVEIADDASLDMDGANGMTMCAWIKPDNAGQNNNARIIDKSNEWSFQLYVSPAASHWVGIDIGSGNAWGTSNANIWTASEWHCVCTTVTTTNAYMWRDGVSFGMSDPLVGNVPPSTNTDPVRIGIRAFDLNRDYDGRMAYIQLWDEPITSDTTIANACNNPCSETTDLVHAWTLTDSGGTQTDYVGAQDGTDNGNVTVVTTDGPPITGMSCTE